MHVAGLPTITESCMGTSHCIMFYKSAWWCVFYRLWRQSSSVISSRNEWRRRRMIGHRKWSEWDRRSPAQRYPCPAMTSWTGAHRFHNQPLTRQKWLYMYPWRTCRFIWPTRRRGLAQRRKSKSSSLDLSAMSSSPSVASRPPPPVAVQLPVFEYYEYASYLANSCAVVQAHIQVCANSIITNLQL